MNDVLDVLTSELRLPEPPEAPVAPVMMERPEMWQTRSQMGQQSDGAGEVAEVDSVSAIFDLEYAVCNDEFVCELARKHKLTPAQVAWRCVMYCKNLGTIRPVWES